MGKAALVLLLVSGCSVAFVKDPPSPAPPPGHGASCTTSPAWPIADFALAGVSVGMGVVAYQLLKDPDYGNQNPSPYKAAAVTSLFVVPFVLSGVVGLVWTNKCSAIKNAKPSA
jgi:hypothetical protein